MLEIEHQTKSVSVEEQRPNTLKSAISKKKISQQIILIFNDWYFTFAKEQNIGSPRVLSPLKLEAKKIFLRTLEELSPSLPKIGILTPVFIFSFFRDKGFSIPFHLFRSLSGLTRHKYFQILKRIAGIFPNYATRDRKHIILKGIANVKSSFHLDSQFIENSGKIMQKLWSILSNTTDSVVVSTVSVLALLPSLNNSINPTIICKKMGVSHSAVIYQVKRIVKAFNISGYTTLNKSRELLCVEVLEKVVNIPI